MLNLEQLKGLHAAGKLVGFHDVEEGAYHAFKEATSQSGLKGFKRSPAHAKMEMEKISEATASMILGTAVHCSTLEPKAFDSRYVAAPKFDRRTTAGKEAAALFDIQNKGKIALSPDDFETVKAMTKAIKNHEIAAKLTTGIVEKAAFWIDEETGILCKCKPDAMIIEEGVILDLKTTCDDATEKDFCRSVANYGYHVQAAFYLEGIKEACRQSVGLQSPGLQSLNRFVFLVAEKNAPHGVALFELEHFDLERGRETFRKYLQELAMCRMENHWPSYRQGIQTVQLPPWA